MGIPVEPPPPIKDFWAGIEGLMKEVRLKEAFQAFQKSVYQTNGEKGFHENLDPENHEQNGMRVALIMGEAAEAYEELRKLDCDMDHVAEELADVVIRTADFAEVLGLNLGEAIVKKMAKNKNRPYKHGKRF